MPLKIRLVDATFAPSDGKGECHHVIGAEGVPLGERPWPAIAGIALSFVFYAVLIVVIARDFISHQSAPVNSRPRRGERIG